MKLPKNNLNYPVKILIGNSSGSGFIIKHKTSIFLVSAKHVIYQPGQILGDHVLRDNTMLLICHMFSESTISQQTPPLQTYEIDLVKLSYNNNLKPHDTADIFTLKIGDITIDGSTISYVEGVVVKRSIKNGKLINYDMAGSKKFTDVEITNDVYILGYPVSLSSSSLNQIDYDVPLARKGIVAGKNYKNRTIILDCPVYGGNSGGLVLEMNEVDAINTDIHLIGVVVQFVPFLDQWSSVRFPELFNTSYQNSGYSIVIPVDFIYDLIL